MLKRFLLAFRVKSKLHEMMQQDREFTQEDDESLNPCHQISISKALSFIQNPVQCCLHIHRLINSLSEDIERQKKVSDDSGIVLRKKVTLCVQIKELGTVSVSCSTVSR